MNSNTNMNTGLITDTSDLHEVEDKEKEINKRCKCFKKTGQILILASFVFVFALTIVQIIFLKQDEFDATLSFIIILVNLSLPFLFPALLSCIFYVELNQKLQIIIFIILYSSALGITLLILLLSFGCDFEHCLSYFVCSIVALSICITNVAFSQIYVIQLKTLQNLTSEKNEKEAKYFQGSEDEAIKSTLTISEHSTSS